MRVDAPTMAAFPFRRGAFNYARAHSPECGEKRDTQRERERERERGREGERKRKRWSAWRKLARIIPEIPGDRARWPIALNGRL